MQNRPALRELSFVALLLSAFLSGAPVLADDDDSAGGAVFKDTSSSSSPSWILAQPKPYTRAHEYFTPGPQMSTLSGTPYTGGYWGNSYLGAGALAPGFVAPYAAPLGGVWATNPGYGGYGGWGGWGHHGITAYPGSWGGRGYGSYFGAPGGYGGWGYGGAAALGLGGFANYGGFGYGGLGYGGLGYGGLGYGGFGYGGLGYGGLGYGGFGFGGFGGGTELGLTTPSHVVQTEPSKASGNYYAPSTVDTTASGSYYAQTDATSIQMPAKRPSTNSNYWKPDASSNYWGSGGGSATPFGKDLNSVPWNK